MDSQVKKKFNKLIAMFAIFLMMFLLNSIKVQAAEGDTIKTGTTGSCTYTIIELADGNYSLTISGSGAMSSYTISTYTSTGWYTYRTKIETIIIEDGVTTIGNYAFYDCTLLTSIEIPSSVTSIGSYAFGRCTSLININVDENNTNYASEDGVLYNKDMTTLICYPAGKTDANYTVPSTVTSIESYAFYNCTALESIDLSNCTLLTSLGSYTFYGCTALVEINLTNCTLLTGIEYYEFYSCTSLEKIDLSNCTSLTYLSSSSFMNCVSLKEVILPTSLTSLGYMTFYGCLSLIDININDCKNLTSVQEGAFAECESLEEIDLSNMTSLIYIGISSFAGCLSLSEINLSGDTALSYIDTCAFYCCESLEEIDLSSCTSLTNIYNEAFEWCESLRVVKLPSSLKTIGNYAFYSCSSLENINLSELTYLTTIGNYAFYYCTSLTSIELPSSIETIGNYAFDFTSLVNIDLSNCASLTSIGYYAFFSYHSDSNQEINISLPKDTEIYLYDGVLFDSCIDGTWYASYSGYYYIDLDGVAWLYYSDSNEAYLAFVPSGIETYEVPSTVTINETEYDVVRIDNLAFSYSSDLTETTFEDISKITWLDTYAFAYCENLEIINGYSILTEIQESFENETLSETMVEATNISTQYNLYVEIDLTDYATYLEELIKKSINVDELEKITLQLYCNGEIEEEKTIYIEDVEIGSCYYVFSDLSIDNEYYIDIVHDNSRWGANILYGYAGSTIPTYAWVNIGTKYAYTISLDIDEENSNGELESVEIEIVDEDGNVVETATLTAENNWTYVYYNGYSNNRYSAKTYTSKEYTINVIENEDYNFDEEIIYENDIVNEYSLAENYAYTFSCYTYDYFSYSYTPGATISLAYSEYSDVTVHHYIYDENAEDPHTEEQVPSNNGETVADETLTGIVGDEYTTSASSDIAYNYEYIEDSENTSGTYTSEEIEVIYYYKLKDAEIESDITKTEVVNDGSEEGSTSITEKDQTITYTISYNASIDEYIGNGTITIVDELPYEIEDDYTYTITIDGEESDITAVYDSETKTLTWEIPVQDVNTYDEDGNSTASEIAIEIILTVSYVDLDYMETSITNNVTGTLYLDATKQEVSKDSSLTVEQKYEISIPVEKVWVDSDDANEQRPESVTIELKVKTIEEAEDAEEATEEDAEDSDEVEEVNDSEENDEELAEEVTEPVTEESSSDEDDSNTTETNTAEEITESENDITDETDEADEEETEDNTIAEESEDSEEENITYETAYDYDGNEVEAIVLSEENDWSGVFENLPKYDSEGNEIEYVVVETETNEYDLEHYKDAIITYGEEYVEIRNVYKYLETDLDAQITKTATPEITSTGDTVVYTIEYTATIKNYIGNAQLVVTDVLPYDIDEELSDLGDGVYDSNTHTITWTIEIEHINTDEDGDYEVSFTREFSVVYGENIDLSISSIDADVEATIYLTDTNEVATVEDDAETIITIPGKVTVKYVDKDTDEELTYIDEETGEETTYGYEINGYTGEEYTTEQKEIDGYTFVEVTENSEGIIDQEEIEVIYYYTRTPATVYVKYLDEDGNEIADSETIEGYVNDEYTTEQKEFYGYTFEKSTENTEGTMTDEDIEVIYYYNKIPATVHVTYLDEDGNEIADSETIEGYVNDEYKAEEKDIKYYTLTETPENAEGVMTEETIEVVYQYEQTSGVVNVKYVDEDGNEIADSEIIEDLLDSEYTTEQKDIYGYTFVESTENTEGTITKEAIEVIYYYTKKESSVHVTYIDQSTNEEIADDETIEGYVGDEYTTEQKEITYYTFVKSTYNTTGKMEEEVIEVIYYYKASTFNMSINKKIGSITKNGTTTVKNSTLEKVEVGRNDVSTTSITVRYIITVTNTGDIAGTATVADYLPDYFTLSSANPSYWTNTTKGYITADVTLEAGESIELTVVLDWTQGESNFGTTTNTAMIIETSNAAGLEEASADDNESSVNVVLSVRTGWDTVKEVSPYVVLAMCGIALILIGLKRNKNTKIKN